jgi:hypothetical protein
MGHPGEGENGSRMLGRAVACHRRRCHRAVRGGGSREPRPRPPGEAPVDRKDRGAQSNAVFVCGRVARTATPDTDRGPTTHQLVYLTPRGFDRYPERDTEANVATACRTSSSGRYCQVGGPPSKRRPQTCYGAGVGMRRTGIILPRRCLLGVGAGGPPMPSSRDCVLERRCLQGVNRQERHRRVVHISHTWVPRPPDPANTAIASFRGKPHQSTGAPKSTGRSAFDASRIIMPRSASPRHHRKSVAR